MNRYLVLLGLLVGAAGVGILISARRSGPARESALPTATATENAQTQARSTFPAASTAEPPATVAQPPAASGPQASPSAQVATKKRPRLTIKAGEPIPELFPHQAERTQLYALAATQDPNNIPTIASSLTHQDANVREAARQALIQMGNSAAIPHLQKALASNQEAAEKELLREAIEFLSLPNFMDVITANHTPAHPVPSTP